MSLQLHETRLDSLIGCSDSAILNPYYIFIVSFKRSHKWFLHFGITDVIPLALLIELRIE